MRTAILVCVLALVCASAWAVDEPAKYTDEVAAQMPEVPPAPQAAAEAPVEQESEEQEDEEEEEEEVDQALVEEEGKPKTAKSTPIGRARKPFKFHPERVVQAQTTKVADPEMDKLEAALAAVKEDILSTHKQIQDERKWVIAVNKIIASYNEKMKRVELHIVQLRKEMKNLYKKKKQIENLKLQRALQQKLKEAQDELATLTASLKHVTVKQGELNKSGGDLRMTIAQIQAQLAKLRGHQKVKKAKKAKKSKKGKGKKGKKGKKAMKKLLKKLMKAAKKAAKKSVKSPLAKLLKAAKGAGKKGKGSKKGKKACKKGKNGKCKKSKKCKKDDKACLLRKMLKKLKKAQASKAL